VKVDGRWCYLYRAIDADGTLVDSMLSETRDMDAAKYGERLRNNYVREWLNLWAHEIPDVTGVGRIGPAMELATVPGIHEELDGAA